MAADREAQPYWEDWGAVLLLTGVLLPPTAWFLDLQVSYALVKWACAHDQRGVIVAAGLGSLALIASAAAMSWSCWKKVRSAHDGGGGMEDRSYMLALSGIGLSGFFALLVVTSMTTRLLSPCQ
jgi:hypothetical protein